MITPELDLAVECCRWNFSNENGEFVHRLSAEVDWPRFVRMVRLHRIQGLVWNSLAECRVALPLTQADSLSSDATAISATNLRTAVECARLLDAFERAAMSLLFIKGLTLGALAYPRPLLKMGWDIDLLIAPDQVLDAAELLRSQGYAPIIPKGDTELESWHRARKESVWLKQEGGFHVELHTRLADNPRLIPAIDIFSPEQEVVVANGVRLPTLRTEELFAYLCVHGASSNWFRLKWIIDLAALLHGLSPQDIAALYGRSQELGAARAAAQALLLAHRLYGTLKGSPLAEDLSRDRTSRWLAQTAFQQIAGYPEPREPTGKFLGTFPIHLTQFFLLPGWKFKVSEFRRQLRDMLFRGPR